MLDKTDSTAAKLQDMINPAAADWSDAALRAYIAARRMAPEVSLWRQSWALAWLDVASRRRSLIRPDREYGYQGPPVADCPRSALRRAVQSARFSCCTATLPA